MPELSSRYQAAGCASLGFKPRLGLKLKGGTRRGAFPALHASYIPRKHGDANLSRLALTFPDSEFIEQGHFRTICTRVQFAAGPGFGSECPKGSIYGHVKVFTPLLDEPLTGPVYLRSSNHNLPDAVLALHGLVDIEVATRIDSVHGRLRATVANAPDAPVSRAIVNMQGGRPSSTSVSQSCGVPVAGIAITSQPRAIASSRVMSRNGRRISETRSLTSNTSSFIMRLAVPRRAWPSGRAGKVPQGKRRKGPRREATRTGRGSGSDWMVDFTAARDRGSA